MSAADAALASKEVAFYYPNATWLSGDWIKNLILFFDGVALLLPQYMRDWQHREDPAITSGLEQNGLLHIIEPERAVGKAAAEKLAEALADIIASGALDDLALEEPFHELSMSRLGYNGDAGLAQMIFEELRSRNLARDSEDGVSIPMHPMVRSLVLVLLSQFLRPYGKEIGADLSPATDRAEIVSALANLLDLKAIPSTQSVIQFDLNTVGVDLSTVPIDEVLDFRKQNLVQHRNYCLAARRFAQELSHMGDDERVTAFEIRQTELDQIGKELRSRARKVWKKPASFSLTLAGAAVNLALGHPLAAALTIGAATLGYSAQKPAMGAYSYLFRANHHYGVRPLRNS